MHSNRLVSQSIEQRASGGRRTAIEAKDEFVQVVVEVLVGDRTLVSTHQPSLHERNHPMDSRQQMCSRCLTALHLAVVDVSIQIPVGDKPVQADPAQVQQATQTDSANPLATLLGGDHDQGSLLRASAFDTGLLISPVRLIHFHDALQALATRTDHRTTQFVEHGPGGFITPQAQDPLQSQSADAVLLAGYLPHGAEPSRQGQMTVLKDRARGDRHLVSTLATAPAGTSHRPCRLARASRTYPSGGPAQGVQVRRASLLSAEASFQFQQGPRIVLAHGEKHYILGLVASSKYP